MKNPKVPVFNLEGEEIEKIQLSQVLTGCSRKS
jgi:hypothetical protein